MRCSQLLVSLVASVSIVSAARNGRPGETKAISAPPAPGAYIVEFEEGQDINDFRLQAEPEYDTRIELNYELFHGVSIQLRGIDNAEQRAQQLASLPAVKAIWPVRLIDRPDPTWHETGGNKTSFDSSAYVKRKPSTTEHVKKRQDNGTTGGYAPHIMTQIDKLHAEGITGAGIRIAVIDSGVDYNHPTLGGCFGEGCLVVSGYDLVGNDYNGAPWALPVPDDDPMDCYGHGTHVSGIIAAQENDAGIIGAAPGVSLSAYRVFGCVGGSSTDVLIAAFNQAYEEGADIISASLGGASGWSDDPLSSAVSRIVDHGVPCIVAAGNSGRYGLWDTGAPANGNGVVSIASFENTDTPIYLWQSYRTVDNQTQTAFTYDWGYPTWNDTTIRSVWVTGYDTNNTVDACEPLPDDTPDLSEYNVLIRRSTVCDELVQAANVAAKGGRWLTIYNNMGGIQWFVVSEIEGIEGVIAIEEEEGISWVKALEAGSEVHTSIVVWDHAEEVLYVPNNFLSPGAVNSFSSQGPSFDMTVKPQFGAPGGTILSTLPIDSGAYGIASGTSMATPLAAGAYALIMEARGRLSPAEIETILAASSKPQLFLEMMGSADGNMDLKWGDWLTPVLQQGAGLIQVYDAIHASTLLQPSSLSFNDTANRPDSLNFTLSNTASEEIAYVISHVPTRSLYSLDEDGVPYVSPNNNTGSHAVLNFSHAETTIAPGSTVTISVTATPPQGVDETRYPVWSGWIAVNGSDGTSLSLPYQGVSGSLYEATPVSEEGAYVINSTAPVWDPVAPNTTFTLPIKGSTLEDVNPYQTSVPVLNFDLYWGSPLITADVVSLTPNASANAFDGTTIGQLPGFPYPYVARGYWGWVWLGDLDNGDYAPAGRYKIITRFLRITGDESNEDDWIVTESTPFGIVYTEE
ncbi:peptidase S8/S53 domain-containing protein [Stachybotrys elegans]|uniref:Peptidase S8/S53 domain-containing protein n=1 Tax=Stachybotrys elegans TaxID=80388 RepID=A0A8K0SKZ3_9HYPO|nr:peptidase S8/S53 domain-containing protein [Stachybotrys elegans]